MTPRSVLAWRYVTGAPMNGRDGYPWRTRGAGRWPGWKRQVVRLTVPVATVATVVEPRGVAEMAAATLVVSARTLRRRWRQRRFRATYLTPTLAALSVPLGGVRVRLHVDPDLGTLKPRLERPFSPAEAAVRRWYGHAEQRVRWPVDRAMVAWWWVQGCTAPAVEAVAEKFRRPGDAPEQRIELVADTPYLTDEQRRAVSSMIKGKIPVADLIEKWDQVGAQVKATWTVRKRPPSKVGADDLLAALPRLAEWEFFLGLGVGAQRVTISLTDDSAHLAVSAGSGAGKSVLAQLVAVQVIARGGFVTILDRKGSHRWARDVIGVDYCTQPDQMHNALLHLADLADRRNTQAYMEADDWDCGPRHLVICEELNATIGQLANFWAGAREKSDPKRSPAISALADILFMGRAAKVNVLAIAQMLTARAIGGPEARENFGIRLLARYTSNAWKMLVPEAPQPRPSRTLGRWQLVVGGVATEVQVCYLTPAQARAIASPVTGDAEGLDSASPADVTGNRRQDELLSIKDACEQSVLPWSVVNAKRRLIRARAAGRTVPLPAGKRGLQTDLYRRADLLAWVASESVS